MADDETIAERFEVVARDGSRRHHVLRLERPAKDAAGRETGRNVRFVLASTGEELKEQDGVFVVDDGMPGAETFWRAKD